LTHGLISLIKSKLIDVRKELYFSLAKRPGINTIYSKELKNQWLIQTFASEIPNGKVKSN